MKEVHVGVSALRSMNKTVLAEQKDVVIIHDHAQPVAVIIPYPAFMAMQELRRRMNDSSS